MAFEKELYDIEYEKATSRKVSISIFTEDWIECNLEDLKVGDIIYVDYFPDSQKYIYTYPPEYGNVDSIEEVMVTDLNNKTTKELSIKIVNHNGQLVELVKDNLSIYSRGYFMSIKKYELKHAATLRLPGYDNCYICNENHKECLSE